MLLALWPLFISTSAVYQQQDISHLVTQLKESKYAQVQHVSFSDNSAQIQNCSGKIRTLSAKASAHYQANAVTAQNQASSCVIYVSSVITHSHAETSQYQQSSSSISASYVYCQASAITGQNQASSGTITATLPDKPSQVTDKHIGLYASSVQSQHIVGKIISKQVSIGDNEVSVHYHHVPIGATHTAQEQVSHGEIVTNLRHLSISAAISEQRQGILGSITTNDDSEMMMVLLALLALDDEIV